MLTALVSQFLGSSISYSARCKSKVAVGAATLEGNYS